jgi:hypothetical protein
MSRAADLSDLAMARGDSIGESGPIQRLPAAVCAGTLTRHCRLVRRQRALPRSEGAGPPSFQVERHPALGRDAR